MIFNKEYRITDFVSAFSVKNSAGQVITMRARDTSCLIFTQSGRIGFVPNDAQSGAEREVACEPKSPIYIPRGASYVNTCKESSESIMFNFIDENGPSFLCGLPDIGSAAVKEAFGTVKTGEASPENEFKALSTLYLLISEIESTVQTHPLMRDACEYILRNYSDPTLDLDRVARAAHVSKIWLCKRFPAEYGTSPFKYLTRERMKHAFELIREGFGVSETALQVGYSDVYGFSRAYKRYFGHSPSDDARRQYRRAPKINPA